MIHDFLFMPSRVEINSVKLCLTSVSFLIIVKRTNVIVNSILFKYLTLCMGMASLLLIKHLYFLILQGNVWSK